MHLQEHLPDWRLVKVSYFHPTQPHLPQRYTKAYMTIVKDGIVVSSSRKGFASTFETRRTTCQGVFSSSYSCLAFVCSVPKPVYLFDPGAITTTSQ